jgi:hypothetical protein
MAPLSIVLNNRSLLCKWFSIYIRNRKSITETRGVNREFYVVVLCVLWCVEYLFLWFILDNFCPLDKCGCSKLSTGQIWFILDNFVQSNLVRIKFYPVDKYDRQLILQGVLCCCFMCTVVCGVFIFQSILNIFPLYSLYYLFSL